MEAWDGRCLIFFLGFWGETRGDWEWERDGGSVPERRREMPDVEWGTEIGKGGWEEKVVLHTSFFEPDGSVGFYVLFLFPYVLPVPFLLFHSRSDASRSKLFLLRRGKYPSIENAPFLSTNLPLFVLGGARSGNGYVRRGIQSISFSLPVSLPISLYSYMYLCICIKLPLPNLYFYPDFLATSKSPLPPRSNPRCAGLIYNPRKKNPSIGGEKTVSCVNARILLPNIHFTHFVPHIQTS